ncbi:MAG: hypothetical protein U0X39_11765 [Bacteroidales bacterium]
MKTLKNSLILFLLLAMLAPVFTVKGSAQQTIILQPADKNITAAVLEQSAAILAKRLDSFADGKSEVSVVPGKMQIKVILSGTTDIQTVEKLLTRNGKIEFYETLSRGEVAELMKGDNHLFSMLSRVSTDMSDAKLGYAPMKDKLEINTFLRSSATARSCRFAWSYDADGSDYCLYALKLTGGKGPVITGSDIAASSYTNDRISITVKPEAAPVFAAATRDNMNRVIAIVLDDAVVAAPRVRMEITSGHMEISGNFTRAEAGYLAALLNNDRLPADLVIVR